MTALSVLATTVVGLAFVVAGSSKLVARAAWRAQAAGFGAPAWVAAPLPLVEIVVGAAVVTRLAIPVSVGLALLVLVGFTAAIVGHLVRGSRPVCACFGAWSSSPIGWRHLVRNGVLVGACVVALVAA